MTWCVCSYEDMTEMGSGHQAECNLDCEGSTVLSGLLHTVEHNCPDT